MILTAIAALALPPVADTGCLRLVRNYAGRSPEQPRTLNLTARNDARLTMIGVEHLRDPAHPQFARIRQAYADLKPTIVFFEGADRGTAETEELAITTTGESGFIRFLAKRSGAELRRLETSPVEQVKALASKFSADSIMLFFVLREAVRLRDREAKAGDALDAAVAGILARSTQLASAAGLRSSIHDMTTLDAAARQAWRGRDWRSVPAAWFTPIVDRTAQFTNRINAADSHNRDIHMTQVIGSAMTPTARVMVVVGKDHVPQQAPALTCLAKR